MTLYTRFDKARRIIATGFCFSLFGIGGLFLTFILIPLLTFTLKNQQKRELKAQKIIQQSFFLFCETMRLTGCIDYKIEGGEQLKSDKNCIIVGNHPSLIDYVLLTSQLPQCDCLVKEALWHNPFLKGVVSAAGYIPNSGPEMLLNECASKLNDDHVLLIFPEGTRSQKGVSPKLQRGAAQIAIKTQTDIRVVHVNVTPSFLTKQAKWYQVPDTKPLFYVQVKNKIAISDFIDEDTPSIAVRKLNRHLTEIIFPKMESDEHQGDQHAR
ncbi:MAG TPA: 1-acyl-sn-glycerol-3-phosphate acyltransferase [Psychromonas hadalis]|nr:1-acyl-sn-glycerol-3-phosphate acyltransferase [Psychromonas hadalis]